ncbi:MAG TPA: T9SS type A sorting domain-containing protein [Flavobacteriales bacterium]|jgi:hypothetical protein|nr:T9SS type A sorting domain-containing protein [Flavobacteriales bacterium]
MRTPLLPIAILFCISVPVKAQLHAGEIPTGASAVDVGIDLILNTAQTQDAATFEIDCDDQPDIMAVLINGAPPIDAPNIAQLHLLDDDLELCADLATFQRPQYYTTGELLACTGNFDWQSDSVNVLGDFGSFTAIGPSSMDTMYVAYRRGAQVGWILLSFDVDGLGSSRLQIHRVLPVCPITTGIAEQDASSDFALYPNPSNGEPIGMNGPEVPHHIEVLDAAGRVVARHVGTVRTFPAPEQGGTYLVRAQYTDGRRSTARLVRY